MNKDKQDKYITGFKIMHVHYFEMLDFFSSSAIV